VGVQLGQRNLGVLSAGELLGGLALGKGEHGVDCTGGAVLGLLDVGMVFLRLWVGGVEVDVRVLHLLPEVGHVVSKLLGHPEDGLVVLDHQRDGLAQRGGHRLHGLGAQLAWTDEAGCEHNPQGGGGHLVVGTAGGTVQ